MINDSDVKYGQLYRTNVMGELFTFGGIAHTPFYLEDSPKKQIVLSEFDAADAQYLISASKPNPMNGRLQWQVKVKGDGVIHMNTAELVMRMASMVGEGYTHDIFHAIYLETIRVVNSTMPNRIYEIHNETPLFRMSSYGVPKSYMTYRPSNYGAVMICTPASAEHWCQLNANQLATIINGKLMMVSLLLIENPYLLVMERTPVSALYATPEDANSTVKMTFHVEGALQNGDSKLLPKLLPLIEPSSTELTAFMWDDYLWQKGKRDEILSRYPDQTNRRVYDRMRRREERLQNIPLLTANLKNIQMVNHDDENPNTG